MVVGARLRPRDLPAKLPAATMSVDSDRVRRRFVGPGLGTLQDMFRTQQITIDHRAGLDHLPDLWTVHRGSAPYLGYTGACGCRRAAGQCRQSTGPTWLTSPAGYDQDNGARMLLPPAASKASHGGPNVPLRGQSRTARSLVPTEASTPSTVVAACREMDFHFSKSVSARPLPACGT